MLSISIFNDDSISTIEKIYGFLSFEEVKKISIKEPEKIKGLNNKMYLDFIKKYGDIEKWDENISWFDCHENYEAWEKLNMKMKIVWNKNVNYKNLIIPSDDTICNSGYNKEEWRKMFSGDKKIYNKFMRTMSKEILNATSSKDISITASKEIIDCAVSIIKSFPQKEEKIYLQTYMKIFFLYDNPSPDYLCAYSPDYPLKKIEDIICNYKLSTIFEWFFSWCHINVRYFRYKIENRWINLILPLYRYKRIFGLHLILPYVINDLKTKNEKDKLKILEYIKEISETIEEIHEIDWSDMLPLYEDPVLLHILNYIRIKILEYRGKIEEG